MMLDRPIEQRARRILVGLRCFCTYSRCRGFTYRMTSCRGKAENTADLIWGFSVRLPAAAPGAAPPAVRFSDAVPSPPAAGRCERPTKLELRFKMLAGLEASINDQALCGKIFVFVRLRRYLVALVAASYFSTAG